MQMETDKQMEWVTVVIPTTDIEANIVMGRLQTAGIEASLVSSTIGDETGQDAQQFIKVRRKNYADAKTLLNLA